MAESCNRRAIGWRRGRIADAQPKPWPQGSLGRAGCARAVPRPGSRSPEPWVQATSSEAAWQRTPKASVVSLVGKKKKKKKKNLFCFFCLLVWGWEWQGRGCKNALERMEGFLAWGWDGMGWDSRNALE